MTTEAAIARVTVGGPEPQTGTAFFIGDVYALTALHVVANKEADPPEFYQGPITLEFTQLGDEGFETEASVAEGLWDRKGDWVVLECTSPPETRPIELGEAPRRDQKWHSFGYPEIEPKGMTVTGEVSNANLRHDGSRVYQLFSKQAAAGSGAPLHGLSGAPCLIEDRAVGILRSTLIEVLPGVRPKLRTQAATVYACPTLAVLEWQAKQRRARLPGSWSPPEADLGDLLVFLSQRDGTPEVKVKLTPVVEQALREVEDLGLGKPRFQTAAEVLASEEVLCEAALALCRARVVILDATGLEPAIMLLAGIRAVVRRGVTILSVGGEYALGKPIELPYSLLDANVVAHSEEQNESGIDSVELLAGRIRRALGELGSADYLDLPVYDYIRDLPAGRRGVLDSQEGVLVLCSFDEEYTDHNWLKRLKPAFESELRILRRKRKLTGTPRLGVSRSLELNSPRLVSQAVYEMVRRARSCAIDLTGWPPSVLFELGVRLAASREATACLIEADWEKRGRHADPEPQEIRAHELEQYRTLVSLFVPDTGRYDPAKEWTDEPAYRNAFGKSRVLPEGPASGSLHEAIERALDIEQEPASRTPHVELMEAAERFAKEDKPVGLFPGNSELTAREEEADFERLLAAWFYLRHRYPDDDELLAKAGEPVALLVRTLFERHGDEGGKLAGFEEVKQGLVKLNKEIRQRKPRDA